MARKKILLLAGEESGVMYAERLKSAILRTAGGNRESDAASRFFEFRGYADYGFRTVDLAVMGIGPVLMRIFYFLRVARTMKRAIREWRPDAVVAVDYPGMNLKLEAYAKSLGIRTVHIVCPQVWAWKRGRIHKIAASVDTLLCFLPFEPEMFAGVKAPGFRAKFIGHPLVDICAGENSHAGDPAALRQSLGIPASGRLVALLPGSRKGEISRILPRLLEAAGKLAARTSGLCFAIPAASARAKRQIEKAVATSGIRGIAVTDGRAREILRMAEVAAVASGTATLEAALARVPTALVYATTPLFAFLLRYFVTGVRFAGLANIIAERCEYGGKEPPRRRPGEGPGKGGAMPELLQEDFTADALADILGEWLENPSAREKAVARLDRTMALLGSGGDALGLAAREITA